MRNRLIKDLLGIQKFKLKMRTEELELLDQNTPEEFDADFRKERQKVARRCNVTENLIRALNLLLIYNRYFHIEGDKLYFDKIAVKDLNEYEKNLMLDMNDSADKGNEY